MPTDAKVEVTLGLSDGTKIVRIENLADVTTFLEQHEEFVKVVRCRDCVNFYKYGFKLEYTECKHFDCDVSEDGYCAWGIRKVEVEEWLNG